MAMFHGTFCGRIKTVRKMKFSVFLTSSDISAGLTFLQDSAEITDVEKSFHTLCMCCHHQCPIS